MKRFLCLAALILPLAGCAHMSPGQIGAITGAVIGGVAGGFVDVVAPRPVYIQPRYEPSSISVYYPRPYYRPWGYGYGNRWPHIIHRYGARYRAH